MEPAPIKKLLFNRARVVDFVIFDFVVVSMIYLIMLLLGYPIKAIAIVMMVFLFLSVLRQVYFLFLPIDLLLVQKLRRQKLFSLGQTHNSVRVYRWPNMMECCLRYLLLAKQDKVVVINFNNRHQMTAVYLGTPQDVQNSPYQSLPIADLGFQSYPFHPRVVLIDNQLATIPALAIVKIL